MISIAIPCKGRLEHLKRTLPTLLNQECEEEIEPIVVDYDCPDGTSDWVMRERMPVVVVRVSDAPIYNMARGYNIGIRHARGEMAGTLDADTMMQPGCVQHMLDAMSDHRFVCCMNTPNRRKYNPQGCGLRMFRRAAWERIRGYDEALVDWGQKDWDIFFRMWRIGDITPFDRSLTRIIKHGNEQRTQFYEEKSCRKSRRRNKAICENIGREVNVNGYGEGGVVVYGR